MVSPINNSLGDQLMYKITQTNRPKLMTLGNKHNVGSIEFLQKETCVIEMMNNNTTR